MRQAAAFDVRPLTAGFGVEVSGIDLAASGPRARRAAAEVFNRHGVMVVRDQRLTPEQQLDFTRAFGEPETNQRLEFTLPGLPEVYVLSNKVVDGRRIGDVDAGQGWHTDASYLERPALCTLLHALEVPAEGSDTLLADLCAAWNALSAERQAQLDGLQVRHSWRALMQLKGIALAEDEDAIPDVVHPLVRRHPADGRKALWVSTGTTRGIVGMDNPAGLDLLDELVAFATQDRFVYRHKWRIGDLLIWDNRCTLHTGTRFDVTRYERLVHRTWVKGERPV
jgi:taurine dioxygenase